MQNRKLLLWSLLAATVAASAIYFTVRRPYAPQAPIQVINPKTRVEGKYRNWAPGEYETFYPEHPTKDPAERDRYSKERQEIMLQHAKKLREARNPESIRPESPTTPIQKSLEKAPAR